MKAMDSTNSKYGRNVISVAQPGINNSWKMRREHSSRIDTANLTHYQKLVYKFKRGVKRLRLNPKNLTGNSVRNMEQTYLSLQSSLLLIIIVGLFFLY